MPDRAPIETAMEAKLIALRRSVKDGVVISFAIHPNDISRELLSADLGTVFGLGLKEMNDETGTVEEAPEPDTPAPAPVKPERERRRFEELKPSQQAGLLCADAEFWGFINTALGYRPLCESAEKAASSVHYYCDVESRATFDTDTMARIRWIEMLNRFRAYQADRRAEERARRQAQAYGVSG